MVCFPHVHSSFSSVTSSSTWQTETVSLLFFPFSLFLFSLYPFLITHFPFLGSASLCCASKNFMESRPKVFATAGATDAVRRDALRRARWGGSEMKKTCPRFANIRVFCTKKKEKRQPGSITSSLIFLCVVEMQNFLSKSILLGVSSYS